MGIEKLVDNLTSKNLYNNYYTLYFLKTSNQLLNLKYVSEE